MTSAVRFLGLLAFMFAGSYFTVSWITHGLPVPRLIVRSPEPVASLPTFEQTQESIAREGPPPKTLQSDRDPDRDAMRLATLQAANAFALSPCDPTVKANLVAALSAYAKDYADKSGCSGRSCGGEARVKMAAAMFSTQLDNEVRKSLERAFNEGGVSIEDFPPQLRLSIILLARGADSGASPCGPEPRRTRR